MSDIIWSPSDEAARSSAMWKFAVAQGFDPRDYESLHRWSISDPGAFWRAVWDLADLPGERGDTALLRDEEAWMTGTRFFPEARVNLAEALLRRTGDATILVETDETGARREVGADRLRAEVARVAAGLREAGVGPGDRVAAVLPNRTECLVTLLATAAVGGVWTSCSPDFGAAAILDRIGQVEPKVLFVQAHIRYGGKAIDVSDRIAALAERLPGLSRIVPVGDGVPEVAAPATPWAEFGAAGELTFTRVPFDAPCYILYTSGTTGAPKAIVHRTGGVMLHQVKEHLLHGDVRPGDRVMWYSNTAWMMYHWVVASLACEATLVLYDGAPVLKTPQGLDGSPLWRIVEREKLTHLGISPKYLATLADAGFVPQAHHDTSSLRWLMSAGSPVAPRQFDWIRDSIGSHMGFASISGGTEILGCFLLGSPIHPVRRGTLTVKGLGMAVNVLDDRGAPVIGRPGDLVCTEPFPSMPLTFWGDDGDARYRASYFADRPEIWTHGDLATLEPNGSAVIHGRADCTMNPGGVRIGTADIYNVCERFEAIEDCIAFSRPIAGDEEVVLCVKLAEGHAASGDLAQEIRASLRAECSPRHVPAAIYPVADIPYTLNGKRVEAAARASATGGKIPNRQSLANAQCLDEYAQLSAREPL